MNQRSNLAKDGKAHGGKAKVSNLGKPAVRHYRWASENVVTVELCHLGTERREWKPSA